MSINDGPPPEMRHLARPELGQPLSAADAERLLAGQGAAPGAPEDQQALAMMLSQAAGPARTRELAGEVTAVAAFALVKEEKARRAKGPLQGADRRRQTGAASGRRRRTQTRRGPLVAAVASALLVIALSGTAAADALPAPMQKLAHDTFGAPAPAHPVPSVTTTPARRGKRAPAAPDVTPQKQTNSESLHANGNGKAVGKAKAVGKTKSAKPTPHGVAKGHTAAPGHK